MSNSKSGIGNNKFSGQGTITCPAGSYATGTNGNSGSSVDSISSLNCRNIFTGATTTTSAGGFGGSGGKASTIPIKCNGTDGLTGFRTQSNNTNLDRLYGESPRPLAGPVRVSGSAPHAFAFAQGQAPQHGQAPPVPPSSDGGWTLPL